ncbi:type IV secretion protein Rhs [Pseudomonas entomophila]|uniref:RHS repeat-associated core domain-containing protein n=1 Tax=Pseudomonas entomophila TaxID=312306 RepID=UPI0015E29810|nr:RHS repeat-associated core domain-containing protein [Pseudomonas entomophila]MBA1188051.1 type IV secretion protein Rhs [Pseudomonas entomophila]
MFEAARLHDEIEHTSALSGFLLGAAIGIGLALVGSFMMCTGGLGGFLLGAIIGLTASVPSQLLESWGASQGSPAGQIDRPGCSPNVFINNRNAAVAVDSTAKCEKHPATVRVAEGSTNVFINGKPAARKGDKLTCGGRISSGSNNVFIGGGTERYLPVDEEVTDKMRIGADLLILAASMGRPLAAMGRLGLQGGLKAMMPCALTTGLSIITGYFAGMYVIGPAIDRALGGFIGNPVDLSIGRKVLTDEIDFSLPGLMPLEWTRFYASDLTVDSVLGKGWVLPWEQSLSRCGGFVYLTDNQGRLVPFVDLEPGQSIYNPHESIHLVRTQGGHYLLQTMDNLLFYFGEVPNDDTPVPLQRMENVFGHYLHFMRSADGRLTDIVAPGPHRVHLHYDHPLGRLTDVKRVVDNVAVETLVRYRYDDRGQLNAVINRNGDTVRRFSYTDGLMTQHTNALDLTCDYRWEVLDGKPRVVEHWTGDGEHYQFRYDFATRTRWATDALGRELEVQYNKDNRVIASRDFGGERYAMDFDEFGNLIGITLPDDNRLAFKYDEYSRLVEETDPLGRSIRYKHHLGTPLVIETRFPDGSVWKAQYDDEGTLLSETDPLGQVTEYLNSPDGLPHTIIDPTHKSKYLWWNSYAQVERFQDCSGKSTWYRYDERQHLVEVIDALQNVTRLERKPDGEVLRIAHPDGSKETFTYNALGQVLTHTDGKGQTTCLQRTARGLPSARQDANGEWVRYEYDKALRLTALVNENNASYRFAYDASDRLSEEVRVDDLTRRFAYNVSGHLIRLDEIGYGENGERPERHTEFERDTIGRLISRTNTDGQHFYTYDDSDRLLSIERQPTGRAKRTMGILPEKLEYAYDILGRLTREITPDGILGYEYDPLDNLTTLTLPDGRKINHLYYGSGHLHQINLDGQVISDIERDDLHREVYRTQGKLTSCFGYDAMGRKAWQYASTLPADKLSQVHNAGIHTELYVEHRYNPIHRRYEYDPAGELVRTLDKLRGETRYTYQANGQLHSRDTGSILSSEEFRYDAAGNRLDFNARQFARVADNRIAKWRNCEYRYDAWGNLIEKFAGPATEQRFEYDCENRLVKAETFVAGKLTAAGHYSYDSLGRRVAKRAEVDGRVELKRFLWQGLRMLREETPEQTILYLYEPDSYAPLARVDQAEGEEQKVYYFHNDQVGTPLELTDSKGEIVWQATYRSWGEIERVHIERIEQNFRFQGQYFDCETELHCNVFRYYDPCAGRFITQDPIGLEGDYNLYVYAPNPLTWIDPFGWCKSAASGKKGTKKAEHDLEQNGYTIVAEELTMKVNGSRMRADFVARDKQGNLHVFEVKHRAGALTKNQKAAGVFDMNNPANTTHHLGGGVIKPSLGSRSKLKVDTKSDLGKRLGGKGAIHEATFNVLKYR